MEERPCGVWVIAAFALTVALTDWLTDNGYVWKMNQLVGQKKSKMLGRFE